MSKTIRFVGSPRHKEGHAYATPPLVGPVKTRPVVDVYTGKEVTNADGSPVLETVSGWEVGDEVTFDRALAEQYGRLGKDPKDDGDEWAQLHLDTWNNGHPEGEEPFVFVNKAATKPAAPKKRSAKKPTKKPAVPSAPVEVSPPVDAAGDK